MQSQAATEPCRLVMFSFLVSFFFCIYCIFKSTLSFFFHTTLLQYVSFHMRSFLNRKRLLFVSSLNQSIILNFIMHMPPFFVRYLNIIMYTNTSQNCKTLYPFNFRNQKDAKGNRCRGKKNKKKQKKIKSRKAKGPSRPFIQNIDYYLLLDDNQLF